MKKILSLLLVALLAGAMSAISAAPKKKTARKAVKTASATVTPKQLIAMIEQSESAQITSVATLASEIDRAKGLVTKGLDPMIAAKYPAYARKSLYDRLVQGRKAVENYILNTPEASGTTMSMAQCAYQLSAYSDFSSLAMMGELLAQMPTVEAQQKFLEFGLQLSILQNNIASLSYNYFGLQSGFGSMMMIVSPTIVDDLNLAVRDMIHADMKALRSGVATSSANAGYLFKQYMDRTAESTLDPEMLSDVKEYNPEAYDEYRSAYSHIRDDFDRMIDAHNAWLSSLPEDKARALVNSPAIFIEKCLKTIE